MSVDGLYEHVGQRVRACREKIPLSQAALAKQLGVSRTSIVNIEAGRQKPPLHVLWSIAETLNVELSSLIPSQLELTNTNKPIKLDERTIEQIENATETDPVARRHLTSFINRVRREDEIE